MQVNPLPRVLVLKPDGPAVRTGGHVSYTALERQSTRTGSDRPGQVALAWPQGIDGSLCGKGNKRAPKARQRFYASGWSGYSTHALLTQSVRVNHPVCVECKERFANDGRINRRAFRFADLRWCLARYILFWWISFYVCLFTGRLCRRCKP